MDSLVESLSQSFTVVPPTAVPAMLDCVVASTGLSHMSLFSSFLSAFPNLSKDFIKDQTHLELHQCNFLASFVSALCHILKKLGANRNALKSFIWKCFIPLTKMVHSYDVELLNQIAESFFNVVTETNTWEVVEETVVPFFLQSVGHYIGMVENEQLAVYEWSSHTILQSSSGQMNEFEIDTQLYDSCPLAISCHVLSLVLSTALRTQQEAQATSKSTLKNGCFDAQKFVGNIMWDLSIMTVRMLSDSLENRSCAISFLLPCIFSSLAFRSFELSVHGKEYKFSRKFFFREIWSCCSMLLSHGPLERRDAYAILSLFFSFTQGCEDVCLSDISEEFDIRQEKEFWDEMKKGLVDKEGLVRKQTLYILRRMLHLVEGNKFCSGISAKLSNGKSSIPSGMTRRGLWAEREAKSMGLEKICNSVDRCLNAQQRWESFILLYEILEEYGTHLVEAAWTHQITLLLQSLQAPINSTSERAYEGQTKDLEDIFDWLPILWERGFCHHNPQVRCFIMQSFLGIEWNNHGNCAKLVPDSFIFGPFMQGLNDPVHHKEFGVKGVYSSRTIKGAAKFLRQFASCLNLRTGVAFVRKLASVAKQQSFGRAGLMGLAESIASAACGVQKHNDCGEEWLENKLSDNGEDFLDVLRFIIECSKQHFNPNYRLRVCEKVMETAMCLVCSCDVPLEIVLHFVWAVPQEFTNHGGSLRERMQEWLSGCGKKLCGATFCSTEKLVLVSLYDFPERFISHQCSVHFITYDDEDLDAWAFEAKRWARVLFLLINDENHVEPILMFIQHHGNSICKQKNLFEAMPLKFLILITSIIRELQIMQERSHSRETTVILEKFAVTFLLTIEELVSFANLSCSIFWSRVVMDDPKLPNSIRGKLGGPSQRRLSSSFTTAVLKAIISTKTVASVLSCCAHFKSDVLDTAFTSLWKFCLKIVSSPTCYNETEAEIFLAAYEALAPVLKTLVSTFSPLALKIIAANSELVLLNAESRSLLDSLVLSFLENINNLLAAGAMVRTRRAILMKWKWLCLECLLSVPDHALKNGVPLHGDDFFFSDAAVRCIFSDLIENLENAGEESVLSMLRSLRLLLELFYSEKLVSAVSSCFGMDTQMMWQLVRSAWILHVSCNKRRIAPIAALLSSVLHSSVFGDEGMHVTDNAPGPLKWFVEKILEEGTKSPRTIRLAAMHLTGLWLSNPKTIKYYMKELKLLSLYGSVAFDEDFEAELSDNHDAKNEVSLLEKSLDPELTEAFINTELYARVSVAVLFYKLKDLAKSVLPENNNGHCLAALESGKMYLLELLDSAVHDKDLSKELYKKYSGIHRRKIRAWQMLCVLSQFIDEDIVNKVAPSLHICLYRNNLPAVRQYLETFAIHLYLNFPSLVGVQLASIFQDYDMRPQALSSYVFIAANVILHANAANQPSHLNELLPPIVPLLTSHHHSLRGFTQLLLYQVLCKYFPSVDSVTSENNFLEKRCFWNLKSYLEKNPDCLRLRASMEGFLGTFNPKTSVSPAGIFSNRVEELEFECVPTSLMEQVITFLNDVREDLRCSMAKDVVTIKNESFSLDGDLCSKEEMVKTNEGEVLTELHSDMAFDFQKKITLTKHEKRNTTSSSFLGNEESYSFLLEMENEDHLLYQFLRSRAVSMEKLKGNCQNFILVASLLDRIPNLAGLARTCEVFNAAGLTIADARILHDKQFQLISVTAEKWIPIIEVPVNSVKNFLEKKKREGFSIFGLEQTANSIPLDKCVFPEKMVLVLGREKEGIPVDIIHVLDACIEIPQLGVVRSLNVHVSGAIALWEYTRQQRGR